MKCSVEALISEFYEAGLTSDRKKFKKNEILDTIPRGVRCVSHSA
jgi:hypothetical protein